jgi:hypothetical protein
MMIRTLQLRWWQFCKDQGGMEALQTVCIVAIAATMMIAAAKTGSEAKTWMETNWEEMKKESDKGLKASLQNAASQMAGEATGSAYDKVISFTN